MYPHLPQFIRALTELALADQEHFTARLERLESQHPTPETVSLTEHLAKRAEILARLAEALPDESNDQAGE